MPRAFFTIRPSSAAALKSGVRRFLGVGVLRRRAETPDRVPQPPGRRVSKDVVQQTGWQGGRLAQPQESSVGGASMSSRWAARLINWTYDADARALCDHRGLLRRSRVRR